MQKQRLPFCFLFDSFYYYFFFLSLGFRGNCRGETKPKPIENIIRSLTPTTLKCVYFESEICTFIVNSL